MDHHATSPASPARIDQIGPDQKRTRPNTIQPRQTRKHDLRPDQTIADQSTPDTAGHPCPQPTTTHTRVAYLKEERMTPKTCLLFYFYGRRYRHNGPNQPPTSINNTTPTLGIYSKTGLNAQRNNIDTLRKQGTAPPRYKYATKHKLPTATEEIRDPANHYSISQQEDDHHHNT